MPDTVEDRILHVLMSFALIDTAKEDVDPLTAIVTIMPLFEANIHNIGLWTSATTYYYLTGDFSPNPPGRLLRNLVGIATAYQEAHPEKYAHSIKRFKEGMPTICAEVHDGWQAKMRRN
jgi:hypothetical protein